MTGTFLAWRLSRAERRRKSVYADHRDQYHRFAECVGAHCGHRQSVSTEAAEWTLQAFNPTVFALPAIGTLGDLSKNLIRGPGIDNCEYFARERNPHLGSRPYAISRGDVQRVQSYAVQHSGTLGDSSTLPGSVPTRSSGSIPRRGIHESCSGRCGCSSD